MEETTDVKRKLTPPVPANYVSIVQLRERWIKEKELKQRKEQEEKDEERRRNQHAEEQQQTIQHDPEKLLEDLDEKMRLNQSDRKHRGGNSKEDESIDGRAEKKRGRRKRYDKKKKRANQEVEECGLIKPLEDTVKEDNNKDQIRVYRKKEEKAMGNKSVEMRLNQSEQKHWGRNSKKDEYTDGGEARWGEEEEEETAAMGSDRGGDDGLPEKKRGRRKRYDKKKKRASQEAEVVEECGLIKPPEYTVKDQIRVNKKKVEKAMGNKSVEKAVMAIETQFEHLSIKRGQDTKYVKAQTKHDLPIGRVKMPIEIAAMAWVKKGENERACDGNGSGVKPLHA